MTTVRWLAHGVTTGNSQMVRETDSGGLSRHSVAVGPVIPDVGSWEWVGQDFCDVLAAEFEVHTWTDRPPDCDLAIVVKYGFGPQLASSSTRRMIYCPIDAYGSSAEIDLHGPLLRRCNRVILHSDSLRPYFQSYARTEFLDHAIRYCSDPDQASLQEGPLLWVGHRSHLPLLVERVNQHPLPAPLLVLTNLESESAQAADAGFQSPDVKLMPWSAERHIEWSGKARAAFDVKGMDFRQRHKPPAKAIDFLASGLPFAVNADSVTARQLRSIGFEVASIDDPDRWLSPSYKAETQDFASRVQQSHSQEAIGKKLRAIVRDALSERAA